MTAMLLQKFCSLYKKINLKNFAKYGPDPESELFRGRIWNKYGSSGYKTLIVTLWSRDEHCAWRLHRGIFKALWIQIRNFLPIRILIRNNHSGSGIIIPDLDPK